MLGSAGVSRTYLAAPCFAERQQLMGVLAARRTEVRPFTPTSRSSCSRPSPTKPSSPSKMSACSKNWNERTNELTRSVGELKALGEVGQAVSSTFDLETVLTRIVSHAVQLSGTDGGAIYEYDEPSEEFLLRATDHMEEELITALRNNPPRLGDGVVGRAAVNREPVVVPNILEERAYAPRMRQIARTLRLPCQPGGSLATRRPHRRRLGGTQKIHRRVPPRSHRAVENLRDPIRLGDPKRPAVPRDRGEEPADRSRQPAQVGVPRQHVPRAAHAAQRHHRLLRSPAGKTVRRVERETGRVHRRHPHLRPPFTFTHQRDPRSVQGRSRTHGAGDSLRSIFPWPSTTPAPSCASARPIMGLRSR